MIGTGIILKSASAFLLKLSNFDNVFFSVDELVCPTTVSIPANRRAITRNFFFIETNVDVDPPARGEESNRWRSTDRGGVEEGQYKPLLYGKSCRKKW